MHSNDEHPTTAPTAKPKRNAALFHKRFKRRLEQFFKRPCHGICKDSLGFTEPDHDGISPSLTRLHCLPLTLFHVKHTIASNDSRIRLQQRMPAQRTAAAAIHIIFHIPCRDDSFLPPAFGCLSDAVFHANHAAGPNCSRL